MIQEIGNIKQDMCVTPAVNLSYETFAAVLTSDGSMTSSLSDRETAKQWKPNCILAGER